MGSQNFMRTWFAFTACPSCNGKVVVLSKGRRAGKLQCTSCRWLGTLAEAMN